MHKPCNRKHIGDCPHDTRTRPHTSTPESLDLIFDECQRRGIELSKLREKCDNLELDLDMQHTAIRNAATLLENKRVIKILQDYKDSLEYPNCSPGDTIGILIKSSRSTQQEQSK